MKKDKSHIFCPSRAGLVPSNPNNPVWLRYLHKNFTNQIPYPKHQSKRRRWHCWPRCNRCCQQSSGPQKPRRSVLCRRWGWTEACSRGLRVCQGYILGEWRSSCGSCYPVRVSVVEYCWSLWDGSHWHPWESDSQICIWSKGLWVKSSEHDKIKKVLRPIKQLKTNTVEIIYH